MRTHCIAGFSVSRDGLIDQQAVLDLRLACRLTICQPARIVGLSAVVGAVLPSLRLGGRRR